MTRRMEGKVALVTGGASGIGKACARRFAEEGAKIVLGDLGPGRIESAVKELRSAAHDGIVGIEADVSSEDDIEEMARTALSEFGRIDGLVAAAGISGAQYVSGQPGSALDRPLVELPLEDWNRVLQINLTGVMLSDRIVARHLIAQGEGGTIVNIASSAARVALPGAADYCASKAGVVMLTQVLAKELVEHGIRVNAIGPGFIETPMTQDLQGDPEGNEMMLAMTPMGRLGTADEIARTALFLATDESSYTTGHTLYPNGGMFVG